LRALFIAGTCGPASRVPAVPGGAPMAATTLSTSLAPVQPVFSDAERLALAGFLAGYRGLIREAYTLDLQQLTGWCRARSLPLSSVRRCIRVQHDAARATKKRSDKGRCRHRPVVTLTYPAWLVIRSLPVSTRESRCAMCRKPHRTPIRAPPCATTGRGRAWTGMPPTSSPRSSPGQPR